MPILDSLAHLINFHTFFFFFFFFRGVLPTLVVVWPSLLSPPQFPTLEGEYQKVIPAHVFCLRCCLCVLYVRVCVNVCVFVLVSLYAIEKSVTGGRIWGFYPEIFRFGPPPFFFPIYIYSFAIYLFIYSFIHSSIYSFILYLFIHLSF